MAWGREKEADRSKVGTYVWRGQGGYEERWSTAIE